MDAGGTITVTAAASGVTSNGGQIELDANGAGSDIAVNDAVTSGGGAVNILADDDVSFSADGDVSSGNGTVTVDAGTGAVTMTDGALIDAGNGLIDIDAAGNIALGGLTTTSADPNSINLNSGAAVTDNGNAHTDAVSGGRLVIDAVSGIGSGDAIDTTVASIDIDNTGSNNIDINETNALAIQNINQGVAAGTVNVDAGGTITVTAAASGVTSNGGQIELDANGAGSDIAVNDAVTSGGGAVNILADDDVSFGADGDVSSGNGTVTVDAGTGAVTMTDGALIDAGNGLIDIDAAGNIALGGLTTTSADPNSINLNSGAAVTDNGNAHTDAVSGGRLVIDAVSGIGSGDAIDTTVASIDIDNTTSNNIDINETNALAIQNINQGGAGTVNVDAVGTITVTAAASGVTSTGGQIELDANGAGSDIAVNDAVASGGGAVNILAADDVSFGVDGDVSSGNGTVTVDAGTGAVTMTDGALIDAGNGLIDIDAAGNIALGGLLTTSVDADSINLNSGAAVTDNGNAHVDTVSGGRLVIDVVSGVGSADAIETTVASADIDNTTGGNVQLIETDNIDIVHLAEAAGNVNISTTVPGNGTITLSGALSATGAGNVSLTAGGTGDIDLDAQINSGAGTIDLTAAGDDVYIGSAAAADLLSQGGAVTVTGSTILTDHVLIDTTNGGAGAGGSVSIAGTVNDEGSGPYNLTIDTDDGSGGNDDVSISGIVGGGTAVGNLVITANDVILNGVGSGVSGAASVNVTAADGGDDARITLSGSGDYMTSGTQTYNGGTDGTVTSFGADTDFSASAAITFDQLYLDHNGRTLTMLCDFAVDRLIFYRGTLDVNSNTLTTADDLVIFGNAAGPYGPYDPDDVDRGADDDEFKYPEADTLVYYPNNGTYNNPTDGDFSTAPNAAFSPLDGSILTVGGDFYVNGANMTGGAGWTLNIQDNTSSSPVVNGPWGSPYAVAFNMTVSNSNAAGGVVMASETGANHVLNDANDPGADTNNNVFDSVPLSCTNWDFTRPYIASAETVYDNMIRVTFSEPIENTNGEILDMVSQISTDGDTVPFTGTFFDNDGNQLAPPYNFVSTDTQDDLQTFFLQVDTGETWNTDATGPSAAGALNGGLGHANSTDRVGVHQAVIPDIDMLKGVLFDAGGHNMARNYGENAVANEFDGVTDECRPALVEVVAGRAEHIEDPPGGAELDNTYDGHNYFHLRYSEQVDIGDLGAAASNIEAQETFTDAGEHGASIVDSGSDVTFTGYFKYGNVNGDGDFRLPNGSKDVAHPHPHAIFRAAPQNPSGAHGMTIYVAGYRADADNADVLSATPFAGYIGDSALELDDSDVVSFLTETAYRDPAGAFIEVLENDAITDQSPAANQVEYTGDTYDSFWPQITTDISNIGDPVVSMPANDIDGWDVDPPFFSVYESGPPKYYEVISGASVGTGLVNRLDFFVRDNFAAQGDLTPSSAVPITHPFSFPAQPAAEDLGIRDSSMLDVVAYGLEPFKAFSIGDVNVSEASLVSTYNTGLETNVNNTLFGALWPDPYDDSYFRLTITDVGHGWNAITALKIKYSAPVGMITDIAGNLIPSTYVSMSGVERIPPVIELALATVGDDRIYIRFSEPVFGNDSNPRQPIDSSDFTFSGGSLSITGIEPISYYNDGILEAWMNLSGSLTADIAVSGKIIPQAAAVFDKITNEMAVTSVHRTTDIGLGVMLPVWAADSLHNAEQYGSDDRTLRVFNGTGFLSDSDITLEASVQAGSFTGLSSGLYFDVAPDSSVLNGSFWLPSYNNALVPNANTSARGLIPVRSEGAVRDFLIPSNDEEIVSGSEVEFLLKLGDLFCADLLDSDDPRSIVPWSFTIKDIIRQAAGVTILNNVINPNNGEKTIINYELPTSGMVVINVFNLAGDLVDVIHRGPQGTGTYTYSWDGTNRAGNTVSRGVYFVRVVAPGIDEFRKVMIVK